MCNDTRLPIEDSQSPMIPVMDREKDLCNVISTLPQVGRYRVVCAQIEAGAVNDTSIFRTASREHKLDGTSR